VKSAYEAKRVMMTTDAVGGVWAYSTQLARGLARHGVQVTLVVVGPSPTAAQRAEARAVHGLSLIESEYRLEWMSDPWEDVDAAGAWLLHLESLTKPDVVHLNGYTHGALAWRAPVLVVAHSCVLSWWRAVRGENAPAQWARYRRRVSEGLHCANAVVAPTAAMLEQTCRLYGPVENAQVIYNGRHGKDFGPQTKENLVFSAGRLWDEAKNLRTLDDAANGLPWSVAVAGDDEHPDGWRARPRNVKVLGRLDRHRIREWYGRSSIYALPARYEPFGLSALEAALSGCALVLGDIPSLRELWQDAALFVDPDDTEGLRDTLLALVRGPKLRAKMAEAAQMRARSYSVESMANAYLFLYQDLVQSQIVGQEALPAARMR
jgi:glycogen synthase